MAQENFAKLPFLQVEASQCNKPPNVSACPLLVQVLSPTVLGEVGYGEGYIRHMKSILIDGTMNEQTFVKNLTNFVDSLEGGGTDNPLLKTGIKGLVPLFSSYREYLKDEIQAALNETMS